MLKDSNIPYFVRDFDGKVFVLNSNKTGNAAEAFAATMQFHNKATLVGQNTAGAMLTSIRHD